MNTSSLSARDLLTTLGATGFPGHVQLSSGNVQ